MSAADSVQGLRLTTRFSVPPGVLPRLRYGNSYQVRARAVDLAGAGLSIGEAPRTPAGPILPTPDTEYVFRRFEPVNSPVSVLRAPRQNGETADIIVLREGTDEPGANERHLLPPQTSQYLAELAGRFDDATGQRRASRASYERALRAETDLGTSDDPQAPPMLGSELRHHDEALIVTPYLPDPHAAGVALRNLPGVAAGTLIRIADANMQTASLPQLPAESGPVRSVTLVAFGPAENWPDVRGVRLRLVSGTAPPAWDATSRVLSVFIPPGTAWAVPISSHLADAQSLELMGIWDWTQRGLHKRAGDVAAFRNLALLGGLQALTPTRLLHLVHAVHQPLRPPDFVRAPAVDRLHGASFAYLRAGIAVDASSTGELSLQATWQERTDGNVTKPLNPESTERTVTLFALPLPERTGSPAPLSDQKIPAAVFDRATATVAVQGADFAASRATIMASIAAVEREAQEFVATVNRSDPPNRPLLTFAQAVRTEVAGLSALVGAPPWTAIAGAAKNIDPAGIFEPDVQPGLDEVSLASRTQAALVTQASAGVAQIAREANERLEEYCLHLEFGDTRHRMVGLTPVGLSRFRGFFPADDTAAFTAPGPSIVVPVPSSARPAPPVVRRIVPSFGWRISTGPQPGAQQRHRLGGGLRVFLERPWFSSGEGELLGVVLLQDPTTHDPARVPEFVTRWGRDPIWESRPLAPSPLADDFIRATHIHPASGVEDAGVPAGIIVAGHKVEYDIARDAHICDLAIVDTGSYFPFVRLGLGRLQPHSLPGMFVSDPIIADFAQLVPDRRVDVSPVAGNADVFDISVRGISYRTNAWKRGDALNGAVEFETPARAPQRLIINPGAPLVKVSVEERLPGTMDEAGWMSGRGTISASDVVIAGHNAENSTLLWRGQVRLPPERRTGQFRVVIREEERLLTDRRDIHRVRVPGEPPDFQPGEEPPTGAPSSADGVEDKFSFPGDTRLVFADAILI